MDILQRRKNLLAANRFYNKKNYKFAKDFYSRIYNNGGKLSNKDILRYAKTLFKLKQYQKSLKIINISILDFNVNDIERALYLRSSIYIKEGLIQDSINDLKRLLDINNSNPKYNYLLGVQYVKLEDWFRAKEHLLLSKKLGFESNNLNRRIAEAQFGMNNYTESYKYFYKSARVWENKPNANTKSKLYYFAGLSLQLLGKDSDELYDQAINEDKKFDSKKLGIGIFHEKYNRLDFAKKSYKISAEDARYSKAHILYKLGIIYHKLNNTKDAIDCIKSAIKIEAVHAEWYTSLASILFKDNRFDESSRTYKEVFKRSMNFDEGLYAHAIEAYIKAGDCKEGEYLLHLNNMIKDAHSSAVVSPNFYDINIRKSYAAMYENLELHDKTIVYESFHGSFIGDNPKALLMSILSDSRYREYTHVVVVNNIDKYPEDLKGNENIIFVLRNSFIYAYYLATSKYVINNVTFPSWFIRKDGQRYLNTWHGTPWKSLGRDIKSSFMEMSNSQRNFLQASHIISQNSHTTEVILNRYNITHTYKGYIFESGYPRNDITIKMSQNEKNKLKKEIGIKTNKKVVFYAPTWRGSIGDQKDQSTQLSNDIYSLAELDCELIFRGHNETNKKLKGDVVDHYRVSDDISTNELLAITDVLVTDYSSIAFDYMATGRELVYYLYDYESYKDERGLYFGHEELPGRKSFSRDEMIKSVRSAIKRKENTPGVNYTQAIDRFCPNEDGHATNRVIDFFLGGSNNLEYRPVTDKKTILFNCGPFMSNGITTSAINLLNSIDHDRYDITLLIDVASMIDYPDRIDRFKRVSPYINVVCLPSDRVRTSRETGQIIKFRNSLHITDSDVNDLKNSYKREFTRIMGVVSFDYIIDFEGYSRFNAPLLGMGGNASRKVIYLHNNLIEEYKNKFSFLSQIFNTYKYYDSLISVSEPTSDVNKTEISKEFDVPKSKFSYIENVQNPDDVISKSKKPLENKNDNELFKDITFLNIGRLSVEKDQEKLIRAFKLFNNEYPDSSLLIMGEGPSRARLMMIIKNLNMENKVTLLGNRDNPYPYIKKADCFVLSSNHEGQPVVLYEAMTLEKPIIATDIVANRAVLDGGFGELCDNSIDGIFESMIRLASGKIKLCKFDINKYNKNALSLFYRNVLREKVKK